MREREEAGVKRRQRESAFSSAACSFTEAMSMFFTGSDFLR